MALFLPSFGFGNIFYASILLVNAIAVLSEDRFLARIGWGTSAAADPGFGGAPDTTSVKARLVNLIASVRTLMRIPLIFVNSLLILYLLILG
ncbi:Yos1-like protein [Trichodelitschia bisporula]|uniref:Yos1-like protein n=1 Tax=Trichodelitschia bisporula TaxID=703511 RepID=A0A6G1I6I0_9PEZI|nr:Yos1-like protein [Trichodelitschia bisporula]